MQTMLLLNAKRDFYIKQTQKKVNQKETECIYEIIWGKKLIMSLYYLWF